MAWSWRAANYRDVPAGLIVARGGTNYPAAAIGRPLYDHVSLANLLQPCAAFTHGSDVAGFVERTDRRAQTAAVALATNGDVTGIDFASQANDALARLRAAGWEVESDLLHASMGPSPRLQVAVTYANAYSRASVIRQSVRI